MYMYTEIHVSLQQYPYYREEIPQYKHCMYVYSAALNVPVYRAEMNVVVCIDLHKESSTDIAVQTSNDKVRIIRHLLYTMWVL